jgi:phenylpropionate dioxygenase-like ring-hydroxylating dioxygenase large terminal subunit
VTIYDDPLQKTSERSGGRSARDYLLRDRGTVPEALLKNSWEYLGDEDLPKERFFSEEWAQGEFDKVWYKVWQVVAHVDEIRNVGDNLVYEIGDRSIIVVRTAPDEVKAYYNSCLHRGTQLRNEAGNVSEFRCPFHGWTWNLDGSLQKIVYDWDFEHVDKEKFNLPEVKVELWNQFVFVNFDEHSMSLGEYLGDFVDHWHNDMMMGTHLTFHVRIPFECNWKVGLDAFLEIYHNSTTHPQLLAIASDGDTEYDLYPGQLHWNRFIGVVNVPGTAVNYDVSEQEILDFTAEGFNFVDENGNPFQAGPGETARHVIADQIRAMFEKAHDVDMSHLSDSEVADNAQYYVFPNFVRHSFSLRDRRIAYRFLPRDTDPNRSWFEVYFWEFGPAPATDEKGAPLPSIEITTVPDGQQLADVPELGWLGYVLDQDQSNVARVQNGLRAAINVKPGITLAHYQESRIRHYNRTLELYMNK